jgi:hypothetical protein
MFVAVRTSSRGTIRFVYVGSIFVLVSPERVYGRCDGGDSAKQDFERSPQGVAGLGSRSASLHNAYNADTYEEHADTEQGEDPKLLHDRDLNGQDEVERNSHEARVGDDVANFVSVYPDRANNTACLLALVALVYEEIVVPFSRIRVDLPMEMNWGAAKKCCDNGGDEGQTQDSPEAIQESTFERQAHNDCQ